MWSRVFVKYFAVNFNMKKGKAPLVSKQGTNVNFNVKNVFTLLPRNVETRFSASVYN